MPEKQQSEAQWDAANPKRIWAIVDRETGEAQSGFYRASTEVSARNQASRRVLALGGWDRYEVVDTGWPDARFAVPERQPHKVFAFDRRERRVVQVDGPAEMFEEELAPLDLEAAAVAAETQRLKVARADAPAAEAASLQARIDALDTHLANINEKRQQLSAFAVAARAAGRTRASKAFLGID